jgi:hypothetical protein
MIIINVHQTYTYTQEKQTTYTSNVYMCNQAHLFRIPILRIKKKQYLVLENVLRH